ncbi:DUF6778 family protein [Octadecabacter sp. R77987]|uniref:DUF6778 family protein n=1 Tax=Octadecabacter sp. R77987 TaxID=3093874 RepID=UPI00366FE9D0
MKMLKMIALGALALGVAGCANMETVTRNAPLDVAQVAAPEVQEQRDYSVQAIRFAIPDDLRVSEANSYYPIADIVWRGDALGNRREQIAAIFQTSIEAGTADLAGETAVIVDVTLHRFHSLTERTRYTVGGVHSIKFDLTIRDAETGAIIEGPQRISADLAALGGRAAIHADQTGQGQKVRITTHLTQVFNDLLTGPVGAFPAEDGHAAGNS